MITGILKGMALTLKEALVGERITIQYPFEKRERPYRGKHKIDSEKCIVCRMCERSCLNGAISIEYKEGREKTRKLEDCHYRIDTGKCIWCGICEEICPKRAIELTNEFNMASRKKENLILEVG
jgi:NADH-quinone oxidoreductase subunit I